VDKLFIQKAAQTLENACFCALETLPRSQKPEPKEPNNDFL